MSVSEQVLQYLKEDFDDVYEAGAKSEYDRFWDNYQSNGTKTNYPYIFAGGGWTENTFYPKYDMHPTRADSMFHTSAIKIDLVERLNELGIALDTSKATVIGQMFTYSSVLRVGEINTVNAPNLSMLFYSTPNLHTIERVVLKEDGSQTFSNTFYNAKSLEHLTMSGVIGQSGLSLQWSNLLSLESAKSVLSCLKDLTGTAGYGVYTITLHDDTWGKLDTDGNTAPNGNTWREYVQELGWVI